MELLIVCLDDEFSRHLATSDLLREAGIALQEQETENGVITAKISGILATSRADYPLPPAVLDAGVDQLRGEICDLLELRMVLALGLCAHLMTLEACGIPLSRIRYRPGHITRLPDELLLADAGHIPQWGTVRNFPLRQSRLTLLDQTLAKIAKTLHPDRVI